MGRKLSYPAPLLMTDMQHDIINQIATGLSTTLKISRRAHILLLGYEGKPYSVISKELGIHVQTVKFWQTRWQSAAQTFSELTTRADFKKGMLLFFEDSKRSGKPKKFTAAQESQIIALACDCPANHNIEMTDWTYEMLALTAQTKAIVESISPAQVGRILKNKPVTTP